ncbi:Gfo/Idh/MocA family protein [Novosphingobium sp. Gsoil 351]|uniref:Gfo/Idh/MocA family protein n=1 Tax=Novosphingobium sp. Gsoil 351 TaxID=2675225 RepID=UPI0012B4AE91|nr:Gfo/Idh/MocA family oxidoreductase [Novosphingobium sp. Gsoil 351]QGN56318.1 gfo/Idh/MocA family oxidoreductase [Novosphingobium sp. Gsoil 351]
MVDGPRTPAPIALGLIGVGKIARDQHLPAIAQERSFRLVAMASRDAADQQDVIYSSLTELLAGTPEVTAISLASPPVGRADLAREALLAGKHVMLEKPPCASLGEAHALEALARQKALTLFATWHSREAAGVAGARAWLADKRITGGQIAWREDVRVWHPGQNWIFAPGGMGVFDPGINALSILTEILPGALTLRSADLEVPENLHGPIRARIEMIHDFDVPMAGQFDFLYEGVPHWTIDIHTDQGSLRLDRGGSRLTIAEAEVDCGEDREYRRLYRRFARMVLGGTSEVDLRPLVLVADAMLVGDRNKAPPFHF